VKRVLCAVDLSDVSVDLVQYAEAIAHWYGGGLTVLHVVPTSDAQEMRPDEWVDPFVEQLRMAVGGAGITADRVRCEIDSGEPATAIVARALAMLADTIVLGTAIRRQSAER
jgi:nucleotide-binding universal stress UspA family protein